MHVEYVVDTLFAVSPGPILRNSGQGLRSCYSLQWKVPPCRLFDVDVNGLDVVSRPYMRILITIELNLPNNAWTVRHIWSKIELYETLFPKALNIWIGENCFLSIHLFLSIIFEFSSFEITFWKFTQYSTFFFFLQFSLKIWEDKPTFHPQKTKAKNFHGRTSIV